MCVLGACVCDGCTFYRRKTTTLKYDPPYSKKPMAKGFAGGPGGGVGGGGGGPGGVGGGGGGPGGPGNVAMGITTNSTANHHHHHAMDEVSLDGSSKLVYANQAGFR